MQKFRWAYLGCGDIAQITAKELSDGEIVAVWNRTTERAREFVKKFGGIVYETAEEAITAPGVEGVYIAVTANLHADYMKLCIKHHKPVLCEKPFTVNAKQAQEIFAYAAQEGVYVSEAMWTWHNATACKVKDWITSEAVNKKSKLYLFLSNDQILEKAATLSGRIDCRRFVGHWCLLYPLLL